MARTAVAGSIQLHSPPYQSTTSSWAASCGSRARRWPPDAGSGAEDTPTGTTSRRLRSDGSAS